VSAGGEDGSVPDDGGAGLDASEPPDASADITDPTNPSKDTDCDGLSDAEEFANLYGVSRKKTDPNDPDTDDDGILDGVELGRTSSPDTRCASFTGAAQPSNTTDPTNADTDGDLILDGLEDKNHNGRLDPGETDPNNVDSDGDGIADGTEDKNQNGRVDNGETDPAKADTDGDGLADGLEDKNQNHLYEPGLGETDPTKGDTDGDGCIDGYEDKNHNGLYETELSETNPRSAGDCAGGSLDSDHDGLPDAAELGLTGTDPANPDTDGDGLLDGQECAYNASSRTVDCASDPLLKDTDCDGLSDKLEAVYHTDPRNPDSDGDGLLDGLEAGITENPDPDHCPNFVADADAWTRTDPARADTDCDGILDGDEDKNHNGRVDRSGTNSWLWESDPLAADTDRDGILDGKEVGVCQGTAITPGCHVAINDADCGDSSRVQTDPNNRDTDGDGIPDGEEDGNLNGKLELNLHETNPNSKDTDCDGLGDREELALHTLPYAGDSDGDGILDGVELGRTESPEPTCEFEGDQDPSTRTSPLMLDSDGDLLPDGVEDSNHNGRLDPGESDASRTDTDGDGLRDGEERHYGTDPQNPDSDGDGLLDGVEDFNHNGQRDSGETDALDANTDDDGCNDGEEDKNGDHVVEAEETNPLVAGDCPPQNSDSDCDGLTDAVENTITHTDPNKWDTDGDGLSDGTERGVTVKPDPTCEDCTPDAANPNLCAPLAGQVKGKFVADADLSHTTNPLQVDSDCDGILDGVEDQNHNGRLDPGETDPSNPDTDGDGLPDGIERGVCTDPDTARSNTALTHCASFTADADCNQTPQYQTDPANEDTDGDGILDGTEDANQNGKVDPGELNPTVNGDASPSDTAACGKEYLRPIQMLIHADQKADIAWAVSEDYQQANTTTVRVDGVERGAMVIDTTAEVEVAGFALKITPGLSGADVSEQLQWLELNRIGNAGQITSKFAQVFTTWDNYSAILATYTYEDNGDGEVGRAANDLVNLILPGATGLLPALGSERGPFQLKLELIRRSAQTSVVVASLSRAAALTEQRTFRMDDLSNGSSLAQSGDATGVQCDRMTVQERQKMDFVWVVDNSLSMQISQDAVKAAAPQMASQLGNSTVSWRMALLSSDLDYFNGANATTPPAESAWTDRTYPTPDPPGYPPRYCPFTSDRDVVIGCVNDLGVGGSYNELFFRPVACMLDAEVMGKKHCGRFRRTSQNDPTCVTGDRGWGTDLNNDGLPEGFCSGYGPPPGSFALLPRAESDAGKIRTGANVGFIFLTDTNEQSEGSFAGGATPPNVPSNLALATLPYWEAMFSNIDSLPDPENHPESSAFVAGILCPVGQNCSDPDGDVNTRWTTFLTDMKGVFADKPSDDEGQAAVDQKIQSAITLILDTAIGRVSPYKLTKPPISATIKVAMDPTMVFDSAWPTVPAAPACNTNDVPRSRLNGFDYDPATRALKFYGNCRPSADHTQLGKAISVSYQYWIDRTPNPDGSPPPCDGECVEPMICNPVTNLCECPPDCGGCGDHVCDVVACACVCPACSNCCTGNWLWDRNVCDCTCEQNQSCGPGMTWNSTTCACVCDPDLLGCDPVRQQADTSTCSCRCRDDCGGCVEPKPFCDVLACACGCDPGKTCETNHVVNPKTCECECDEVHMVCPVNQVPNPAECQCECVDCGGGCGDGFHCDPSSCQCVCDTSQSCDLPLSFNPLTCSCQCDPSQVTCDGNLAADPLTCVCSCPSDCGGCDTGYACDLLDCACECPPTKTCPEGYKLDEACTCVCDVDALECEDLGSTYEADPANCSCRCKQDCGGCPSGVPCNSSTCSCQTGPT
jgi:hypothetical protein